MQVLTVDVGTGTQDIFLYDSSKSIENGYQLVMPSPTVRLANQVKQATRQARPVLLQGVLMGGGPVAWAVRDHAGAGYPVFCSPDAARTFDDDPARVLAMGVQIVSDDEAARLARSRPDLLQLTLGDFDFSPIRAAMAAFGLELQPDVLAVAVFDHGAAPPEISDRVFRFDYIAASLQAGNHLARFAFPAGQIPAHLTRFEAVARRAVQQLPGVTTLLMDTGPAAALGALDDPLVAAAVEQSALLVNLGNFHSLAFLFEQGRVCGTFEHHTGELTAPQLVAFLERLSTGALSNAEIFDSQGHGAVYLDQPEAAPRLLAVTGPRRSLLRDHPLGLATGALRPYFAVPNGDMMLAGNFGLLRALQYHFPALALNLEQARANIALEW